MRNGDHYVITRKTITQANFNRRGHLNSLAGVVCYIFFSSFHLSLVRVFVEKVFDLSDKLGVCKCC
jgi:hypothetical protein